MALAQWVKDEIAKKVHSGTPLDSPTPEKLAYYNAYKNNVAQQVIDRATSGGQLYNASAWKTTLFNQTVNKVNSGKDNIGQQQGGTPQYNPMPSSGGSNPVGSNPVLDQTPPVIVTNPTNQPTVPIGTGDGNPVNRMELNSLVAVIVGFFFVRGAFKLLTKIF